VAHPLRVRPAVIAVGAFGEAVASKLVTTVDAQICDLKGALSIEVSYLLVAAWRECPSLFDAADRLSRQREVPWAPVVIEHPVLRVGPVCVPPKGSCYECFIARTRQHDPNWDTTSALRSAYDSDPDLGVGGFLPAHVQSAVGLTMILVERVTSRTAPPGTFFSLNLQTQRLSVGHITPVHGCPRCASTEHSQPVDRLKELLSARTTRGGR
jgi:bacteriocin biosynthesis cyclodehydratase domain-containing protein